MGITIAGRGMRITPDIRQYVEERSRRLEKYGVRDPQISFKLKEEKYRRTAEASLNINGLVLEAKEETDDLQSAVDQVFSKIEKQLKKHKEKGVHHRERSSLKTPVSKSRKSLLLPQSEEAQWILQQGNGQGAPRMLKQETILVHSLPLAEALLEMKDNKKAFFFFRESESRRLQFLFRKSGRSVRLFDLIDAEGRPSP